jgi:hypothetical protein
LTIAGIDLRQRCTDLLYAPEGRWVTKKILLMNSAHDARSPELLLPDASRLILCHEFVGCAGVPERKFPK